MSSLSLGSTYNTTSSRQQRQQAASSTQNQVVPDYNTQTPNQTHNSQTHNTQTHNTQISISGQHVQPNNTLPDQLTQRNTQIAQQNNTKASSSEATLPLSQKTTSLLQNSQQNALNELDELVNSVLAPTVNRNNFNNSNVQFGEDIHKVQNYPLDEIYWTIKSETTDFTPTEEMQCKQKELYGRVTLVRKLGSSLGLMISGGKQLIPRKSETDLKNKENHGENENTWKTNEIDSNSFDGDFMETGTQNGDYDSVIGAVVSQILPGSIAERVGILTGDEILEWNGKHLRNLNSQEVAEIVSTTREQEKVPLRLVRYAHGVTIKDISEICTPPMQSIGQVPGVSNSRYQGGLSVEKQGILNNSRMNSFDSDGMSSGNHGISHGRPNSGFGNHPGNHSGNTPNNNLHQNMHGFPGHAQTTQIYSNNQTNSLNRPNKPYLSVTRRSFSNASDSATILASTNKYTPNCVVGVIQARFWIETDPGTMRSKI